MSLKTRLLLRRYGNRLLLKGCAQDDPGALDEFQSRNCENVVRDTIRTHLRNCGIQVDHVKMEAIVWDCFQYIFGKWNIVTDEEIHERVRKDTMEYICTYVEGLLEG